MDFLYIFKIIRIETLYFTSAYSASQKMNLKNGEVSEVTPLPVAVWPAKCRAKSLSTEYNKKLINESVCLRAKYECYTASQPNNKNNIMASKSTPHKATINFLLHLEIIYFVFPLKCRILNDETSISKSIKSFFYYNLVFDKLNMYYFY